MSLAIREDAIMCTADQELIQRLAEPHLRFVKGIKGPKEQRTGIGEAL